MNREQMLAPFADEELHTFRGRGGQDMTYIEDETVMDRLDVGFGQGNWQVQVEPIPYVDGAVKVRLGVREHQEWTWYEDFGYPNREGGESLKEAVSDGIRRCGRFVGIARDLYRKAPDERRTDARPARQPAVTDGLVPRSPADAGPPVTVNGHGEQLEILGKLSKQGIVRKGGSERYKLEPRETPDGMAFGFRLEIDGDRDIPQVLVEGDLCYALLLATANEPERLLGKQVKVKGRLYNVRSEGRRAFYRLILTDIETSDFVLPAPDVEPMEPPIAVGQEPLFDDAESKAIDDALAGAPR